MTFNYHNFGRCYYTIGSECSGWNYWERNYGSVYSTNGENFFGLENNSVIRGYADPAGGLHTVFASYVGLGGQYIKGSVSLWTASVTD